MWFSGLALENFNRYNIYDTICSIGIICTIRKIVIIDIINENLVTPSQLSGCFFSPRILRSWCMSTMLLLQNKNVLSDLTKSFSFCGKELNIFESNLNFCSVKFSMNCIFTWLHLNIWNISILFLWTSKTNHLHKLILHSTVYHWMVSYLIFVRNARNAVSVKFSAECKNIPEEPEK